mmetsp:Transcript_25597/g.44681  ORF Transcript_25597/g.44681 Transcript_25597/m.44681 type:complete len:160 (+) Transcript_25597:3870-4349(+)
MGCGSTKLTTQKKTLSPAASTNLQGVYKYKISVVNPKTSDISVFELVYDFGEVPFERIMTILSLHETLGNAIDANFMSLYNSDRNIYENYVQRLIGFDITDKVTPNRGKVWVPYLNGRGLEWNKICSSMTLVKYSDEIVWKFQHQPITGLQSFADAPGP